MAKSAIIGGDVAHMVRIVDMAPRSEFWGTDKPLSAYDIHVDAGRAAGMQVDLMISPIADHEGWRVVAIHAHRSEEHTSELQSLMRISYAVFCLKKKK